MAKRITVASFKAWLRKQEPNDTFSYIGYDDCCVGQYLKAHNIPFVGVGGTHYRDDTDGAHALPPIIADAVTPVHSGCTFGGVLRAIEKLERESAQ